MTSATTTSESNTRRSQTEPRLRRRWTRFSIGLLAIFVFAFGVIPAAQQLEPVREVRNAVHNAGIDATALIYSECDLSYEAEIAIRDTLSTGHSANQRLQSRL